MVNYYHSGSRQGLKEELQWMLDDWRWLWKQRLLLRKEQRFLSGTHGNITLIYY